MGTGEARPAEAVDNHHANEGRRPSPGGALEEASRDDTAGAGPGALGGGGEAAGAWLRRGLGDPEEDRGHVQAPGL